jgi:hypothetical protein
MDEFMLAYARDFEITGGEIMTSFLGLQVDHVNSEIHMHMDHYVENVLSEYKTFVLNKTLRHKMLPIQPNYQLPKTEPMLEGKGEDPRTTFYRSFVMKLQYVATWVRFDISFTASQLASHVANPGPAHWAALHHLMEYLDHYPSFKLVYRRGLRTGKELDAFADSDWGTDVETRKSISGQITRFNKTPISWRSKKQQSVALSSAEAEYMAVSEFSKEIIYLRQLLRIESATWDSLRKALRRCTRTTLHASSGETMSLEVANVPSTLTSASTSRMRPSRMYCTIISVRL